MGTDVERGVLRSGRHVAALVAAAALALTALCTAGVWAAVSAPESVAEAVAADTCDVATPLVGVKTITSPAVDSNVAGLAEAFRAKATGTGTADTVCVYVDSTNAAKKLIAGIYADAAGHPGALLGQGTLTTLVNGKVNAVSVPALSLAAGTTYWITILSPTGSGTFRFRDHCCGSSGTPVGPSENSKNLSLTALPVTWASGKIWPRDGLMIGWVARSAGPPPVNHPPTATPREVTTPEDTPLPITLTGADPDADPLSFAITSPTARGALSGTPPSVLYTPDRDVNGTDSFLFTARDLGLTSDPAKVAITITEVNDPPSAKPDAFAVGANEASPIPAAALLKNDSAGPANESGQTLRISAVAASAGTHGTVSVSGTTITYVPAAGYIGPASFTYTLCDDGTTNGVPAPACVTDGSVSLDVTAPDRPPTADSQAVLTPEDVAASITLTGADPDGDTLTYSIVDLPEHGALIGVAPALTFVPAPDFNGVDSFTFRTSDGRASSELATVALEITEVNDPPVLGPDAATLGGAGVLPPPPVRPPCADPCGVMWGDVHNITFDRANFDFQPVGEFVAVKSTVDDFELQVRTAPWPHRRDVSLAVAAAMRVGQHRIGLYRTPTGVRALLDGTQFTVPATPLALTGGGSVGTYGAANEVTVVWPDGTRVFVTNNGGPTMAYFQIKVSLSSSRLAHVVGILGNADGVKTNDVVTRDGQAIAYPPTFANMYPRYVDSWRILQAESLFDYGAGETTETFTDRTFPDAPATPGGLPPAVRAAAAAVCGQSGVVIQEVLDACIVDVGSTGDNGFADDSAAAQGATFGTTFGTPTTVTIGSPGDVAVRTFTATAGQVATLTVTGNTIAQADITIRQPNGTFVASQFVSTASVFHDVMSLPVDGAYTISFDPRDLNTGSLTFQLDTVPENNGTTAIGTPTAVSIGTIGENAVRTFTATAGQLVTLNVTGNTIAAVDITIRQSNGTFVASQFLSGPSAFHDVMTLPVDGTYTITIDPRDQNTGMLTFLFSTVPTNTGTIAIGTPATVTIGTVGENAVRTFTGIAGQLVTLNVSGNTIPGVDLTIRQPNGNFVGSQFLSGPSAFHDVMTLPVDGTYTLTIDPRDQNTGGLTVLFSTVPQNNGTTSIGTPTTVTIGTVGENAVRSFTATAGQQVSLSVAGNTIPGADLTVRQPSGASVGSLFVSGATGLRDAMTMPVTGTYTITIDPRDQNTGSLTFTLNDVPGGGAAAFRAPAQQVGRSLASFTSQSSAQGASLAAAAAAETPKLVVPVADLLANDRPGPANESDQTLTVTAVGTTADSHGTATLDSGTVTYVPAAGYSGPASFTYTACDNGTTNGQPDPRCSTGTFSVKVTANHPPTVAPQQLTTPEDTPLPLTLTGADADGDTLHFTIEQDPSHGTLTGTPPAVTYVPAPNTHGTDSFAFAADDTHDRSANATVQITVTEVNDAPVPQPDSITAATGKPATVSAAQLTANDAAGPFDENSQTLTVTAVAATADTHGTVALAGGTVTYTPDGGFTGTARIAYTVCDNGTTNGQPAALCADGTLSIVGNRPPRASDQSVATPRNTPVPITLTATDPEDDPLTFAVVGAAAAHGTVTGVPPDVVYTPASGFTGADSFTFTANDGLSTSAVATVSVDVTDTVPPTIRPDAVATTTNVSVLIDVLANDTAGAGALVPSTLSVSVAPTNGTAVVEGAAIRYAPAPGVTPDDTFRYRVCDTFGVCGQALVTVGLTVPNRAPVAKPDSYQIDAGVTLSPAAPGVLKNDSDPDPGDTMQARLGTGVSAGNLLLRSDGSFTYTPGAGFAGLDSFTYFVVDRAGLQSAPVKVSIDVIPAGPLAVDDTYTTTRDNPLTVAPAGLLANDRDAHSTGILTASLNRGAPHGTVDVNPDGSFVYVPDAGFVGSDSFLYVVTDIPGLVSEPAHVSITVAAPSGPVPSISKPTPADGSKVTAPTPITAVITPPPGETLADWKVTARNCDHGTPVVLASGTGAPPSPIATFDPTTLANGCYQIYVSATSSGGGLTTAAVSVLVAGEMKLGDYATTYLDLETTIAGFPVQVLRTYDSTDKRRSDFGVGWHVELSGFRATPNNKLGLGGWSTEPFGFPFTRFRFKTTRPHFVTVTEPGGKVELFDFVPAPSGPLLSLTSPEFIRRPGTGTTSTLEDIDSPTLSLAGDSLATFFGGEIYDPRTFRLTTAHGDVLIIDRFDGLRSITDRNGNKLLVDSGGVHSPATSRALTFDRDGAGRITAVTAPGGKHTSYTYSAAGDLHSFVGAEGEIDTFTYDGSHRLLAVDGPAATRLRTLTYGPDGRVTSLTDGAGNTMTLSSNVDARSEVVTSPSGRLTTLTTYGADGHVASKEEAFNAHTRVTRYEYDADGNVTKTTGPLGRVETKTYDAAGNITSRTTPKGETWSYAYNAFGQPTTTTAPGGGVVESHTYDAQGNLTSETLRGGKTTSFTRDSSGRAVSSTDAAGTTTYAYDANDQVVTVTNPAGGSTHYTYDAAGRRTSVEDPAGQVTQFSWDGLDHLVQVTEANGSKQTAAYDAFGRLASLTDTGGRTTTYRYDAADRIVARVDRAGLTTTYAYDSDGNVATVAYPGGDVASSVWDPVGRLVSLRDADTIVEQTYNDANDLVAERARGNNGVALPDVTLTYTTDANGHRTSLVGPGGTVDYGYDSRARLTSVRDGASRSFGLTYDGADRLTALTRPNGVADALSYREDNLVARTAALGGVVVGRADYTLDALNRRSALTDVDGAHAFTHDLADRLTAATHPAASGLPAESFQYDAVGNRTAWAGSPAAAVTYDAAGQLRSDGTYDYTYDAEGRLLERRNRATGGSTLYVWNGAGQLVSVTAPGGAVSTYRYDAFGRRVEANDDGVVRRFVYSGWNLQAEYDGANALQATYVTGADLGAVFEVVRGGTPYYPLFDGVGSVTALTDGAGAVAGRTRYSAYGVPSATGVTDDGFTFTGHQYDDATGLVYARARYYDPTIGRFLSQDPDPALNPYVYAFDAPLEYTDPTGRASLIERIKIMIFGPGPSVGYLASQAARDERARQAALKAAEFTVTVLKGYATPISDVWKAGGGGG